MLANIHEPKLSKQHEQMKIDQIWEEEESYLEGVQFTGGLFQNGSTSLHFQNVLFKHIRFSGADLSEMQFTDVVFDTCDFSNAQLQHAQFHRCSFKGVKLTGADFSHVRLTHVIVEQSDAQYSDFSLSHMKFAAFHEVDLTNANFFGCQFKDVNFVKNILHDASFIETDLANIDLSTNQYDRIEVTIEKLQNCIVSKRQAIGFARLLGIQIKEDG